MGDHENVGNDGERGQTQPLVTVHAATVKLPGFYTLAPGFWFDSAESQFRLKKIDSEQTKFDHVMASLSEEIALQVIPATREKSYATLKAALMEVFDLTEEQRAEKLLHLPGLGDKRPSKLAAEIIALVPDGVQPGYLERQIFLEQLPTSVRQMMAAHKEVKNLRELAKLADGYVVAARARMPTLAAVSHNASHQSSFEPSWFSSEPQGGNEDSSCSAVSGRKATGGRRLCWKHVKFGERAHECADHRNCEWKPRQGNAYASRR